MLRDVGVPYGGAPSAGEVAARSLSAWLAACVRGEVPRYVFGWARAG